MSYVCPLSEFRSMKICGTEPEKKSTYGTASPLVTIQSEVLDGSGVMQCLVPLTIWEWDVTRPAAIRRSSIFSPL